MKEKSSQARLEKTLRERPVEPKLLMHQMLLRQKNHDSHNASMTPTNQPLSISHSHQHPTPNKHNPCIFNQYPSKADALYDFNNEDLVQKYEALMQKLEKQKKINQFVVYKEYEKLENHYNQMIDFLMKEKDETMACMMKYFLEITDSFDFQRGLLQHKVAQVKRMNYGNLETEFLDFEKATYFDCEIVEILHLDLSDFERSLQKYLIKHGQTNPNSCASSTFKENSYQNTMDDHLESFPAPWTQSQKPLTAINEKQLIQYDSLCCDQDLEGYEVEKLQKRKKRKYQMGREEVIRQENQSNESSLLTENLNSEEF